MHGHDQVNMKLVVTVTLLALKISRVSQPDHLYEPWQEPITRSVPLNYTCATAFSQVSLFLD